jgi:exonuclease III
LQTGWVDPYRLEHPNERKFTYWSYRGNCRVKNIGGRLDYFIVNEKSSKAVKKSVIN